MRRIVLKRLRARKTSSGAGFQASGSTPHHGRQGAGGELGIFTWQDDAGRAYQRSGRLYW